MTQFKFATNIESINAAKAAKSATAPRMMNEVQAIQRIHDLVRANDGVTRAVIIEPHASDNEVWVSINKALPTYEKRDIARSLRPAILALSGHQVNRYHNGKRVLFDTWRINADTYKSAVAAHDFWSVESSLAI